MKRRKWTHYLASGVLVLTTLVVAALAAGTQGSQTNPLVTLSYLNEKVLPDILKQVDRKVEEGTRELREQLGESGQASFQAAEAAKGQTVTLSAGTQLILRSGAASCADGLIDLTTGEALWGELSLNHLYIATGEGLKVTAGENSALLILGTHTVK